MCSGIINGTLDWWISRFVSRECVDRCAGSFSDLLLSGIENGLVPLIRACTLLGSGHITRALLMGKSGFVNSAFRS